MIGWLSGLTFEVVPAPPRKRTIKRLRPAAVHGPLKRICMVGPVHYFWRPMARGPPGNLAGKLAGTMKLWQIEAMAKKKTHMQILIQIR